MRPRRTEAGQRITIIGELLREADPIPVGTIGTVTGVTKLAYGAILGHNAQIRVDWENGSPLMLIDGDPYRIL